MRPVTPFRSAATALLAVSIALAACTSAAPSASPSSPPASEAPASPSPSPTPVPVDPTQAPAPTPPPPAGGVPLDSMIYGEMGVLLEMSSDCGLCGPEHWLFELPRFRLYADGLAIYRAQGERAWTAPYHYTRLADDDVADLLRHALDEGGLRGAKPRYRGDSDDAGSTRFVIHGWPVDEDVNLDVIVEPVLGGGTSDVYGDPITDLPRREQLAAFADVLASFDEWVAERGLVRTSYDPKWYAAAIAEAFPGTGGTPWLLDELAPGAFAPAGWGPALARVTAEEAEQAMIGPGGGARHELNLGDGRIGTLLIRPVLPGDDRPGAFGVRPNTLAITMEPDLRIRSLPEISEASVKYEPLLDKGDGLYVIDGPVDASGYRWYHVHAPRAGLTGWVAAGSKSREPWIEPAIVECTLGASPQDIIDEVGYDLMHLACYSGVELGGTYRLAPYAVPNEHELTCPDEEYVDEPQWLNTPLSCFYDFGPEEADTGAYDLPAGGVLHPSLASLPDELLASSPDGLLVEVRGELDHPDARGCTAHGGDAAWAAEVRLRCRTTFVITELRPAD